MTLEERELIRTLARDNQPWGAPHIQGELEKLGIFVSEPTVVTATMQSLYEITDTPTGERAAGRME